MGKTLGLFRDVNKEVGLCIDDKIIVNNIFLLSILLFPFSTEMTRHACLQSPFLDGKLIMFSYCGFSLDRESAGRILLLSLSLNSQITSWFSDPSNSKLVSRIHHLASSSKVSQLNILKLGQLHFSHTFMD